jgi:hypothetical protein
MAARVPPLATAMLGVLLADVLLEIAAQTAATVDPGDRACAKALSWRHDHQMPIEVPAVNVVSTERQGKILWHSNTSSQQNCAGF